MSFKIGDRVSVVKFKSICDGFVGLSGIIVTKDYNEYGVDFGVEVYDSYGSLESNRLNGAIEKPTGYFFRDDASRWDTRCLVKECVGFDFE